MEAAARKTAELPPAVALLRQLSSSFQGQLEQHGCVVLTLVTNTAHGIPPPDRPIAKKVRRTGAPSTDCRAPAGNQAAAAAHVPADGAGSATPSATPGSASPSPRPGAPAAPLVAVLRHLAATGQRHLRIQHADASPAAGVMPPLLLHPCAAHGTADGCPWPQALPLALHAGGAGANGADGAFSFSSAPPTGCGHGCKLCPSACDSPAGAGAAASALSPAPMPPVQQHLPAPGLGAVTALRELRSLELCGVRCPPGLLPRLSALSQLTRLCVDTPLPTNQAVGAFSGLTALKSLHFTLGWPVGAAAGVEGRGKGGQVREGNLVGVVGAPGAAEAGAAGGTQLAGAAAGGDGAAADDGDAGACSDDLAECWAGGDSDGGDNTYYSTASGDASDSDSDSDRGSDRDSGSGSSHGSPGPRFRFAALPSLHSQLARSAAAALTLDHVAPVLASLSPLASLTHLHVSVCHAEMARSMLPPPALLAEARAACPGLRRFGFRALSEWQRPPKTLYNWLAADVSAAGDRSLAAIRDDCVAGSHGVFIWEQLDWCLTAPGPERQRAAAGGGGSGMVQGRGGAAAGGSDGGVGVGCGGERGGCRGGGGGGAAAAVGVRTSGSSWLGSCMDAPAALDAAAGGLPGCALECLALEDTYHTHAGAPEAAGSLTLRSLESLAGLRHLTLRDIRRAPRQLPTGEQDDSLAEPDYIAQLLRLPRLISLGLHTSAPEWLDVMLPRHPHPESARAHPQPQPAPAPGRPSVQGPGDAGGGADGPSGASPPGISGPLRGLLHLQLRVRVESHPGPRYRNRSLMARPEVEPPSSSLSSSSSSSEEEVDDDEESDDGGRDDDDSGSRDCTEDGGAAVAQRAPGVEAAGAAERSRLAEAPRPPLCRLALLSQLRSLHLDMPTVLDLSWLPTGLLHLSLAHVTLLLPAAALRAAAPGEDPHAAAAPCAGRSRRLRRTAAATASTEGRGACDQAPTGPRRGARRGGRGRGAAAGGAGGRGGGGDAGTSSASASGGSARVKRRRLRSGDGSAWGAGGDCSATILPSCLSGPPAQPSAGAAAAPTLAPLLPNLLTLSAASCVVPPLAALLPTAGAAGLTHIALDACRTHLPSPVSASSSAGASHRASQLLLSAELAALTQPRLAASLRVLRVTRPTGLLASCDGPGGAAASRALCDALPRLARLQALCWEGGCELQERLVGAAGEMRELRELVLCAHGLGRGPVAALRHQLAHLRVLALLCAPRQLRRTQAWARKLQPHMPLCLIKCVARD